MLHSREGKGLAGRFNELLKRTQTLVNRPPSPGSHGALLQARRSVTRRCTLDRRAGRRRRRGGGGREASWSSSEFTIWNLSPLVCSRGQSEASEGKKKIHFFFLYTRKNNRQTSWRISTPPTAAGTRGKRAAWENGEHRQSQRNGPLDLRSKSSSALLMGRYINEV